MPKARLLLIIALIAVLVIISRSGKTEPAEEKRTAVLVSISRSGKTEPAEEKRNYLIDTGAIKVGKWLSPRKSMEPILISFRDGNYHFSESIELGNDKTHEVWSSSAEYNNGIVTVEMDGTKVSGTVLENGGIIDWKGMGKWRKASDDEVEERMKFLQDLPSRKHLIKTLKEEHLIKVNQGYEKLSTAKPVEPNQVVQNDKYMPLNNDKNYMCAMPSKLIGDPIPGNVEKCKAECSKRPRCMGFDHRMNKCYLKSACSDDDRYYSTGSESYRKIHVTPQAKAITAQDIAGKYWSSLDDCKEIVCIVKTDGNLQCTIGDHSEPGRVVNNKLYMYGLEGVISPEGIINWGENNFWTPFSDQLTVDSLEHCKTKDARREKEKKEKEKKEEEEEEERRKLEKWKDWRIFGQHCTKTYHDCVVEEIQTNDRMYRKLFKPYPKQWLNVWRFYAHFYRNESGNSPRVFNVIPRLYESAINQEAIRTLRRLAWASWANRKTGSYWRNYRKHLENSMKNSKDFEYTDDDILKLFNERVRNGRAKHLAEIQKVNPFHDKHFNGTPLKYWPGMIYDIYQRQKELLGSDYDVPMLMWQRGRGPATEMDVSRVNFPHPQGHKWPPYEDANECKKHNEGESNMWNTSSCDDSWVIKPESISESALDDEFKDWLEYSIL